MITVNKYYKMSNEKLELEAGKFKIGGYSDSQGHINRERIITQLLEKDKANNSRCAIFISIISLLISIIALLK